METIAADHVESALSPAPVAPAETRHGFEFRGSAGEYFRIWIVNLALTILTLGIYSAWAKVRRLKYLHGNTLLAGGSFGYHGDPIKILKGRAIATILFVAYTAAGQINPVAGLVATLLFAAVVPWLVVKSLKFRMRMTSWRGLRFDFDERYGEAYKVYLGWGLATMLSLGLLFPAFLRRLHQFRLNNAAYGSTHFECDPPLKPFYIAALKATLVYLVVAIGLGVILAAANIGDRGSDTVQAVWMQLLPLALLPLVYVAYGLFNADVFNAVYNHTRLGPHRVHSSLAGLRLAWLYLSNLVAIVVSLGLLVPWATVRVLRYRLDTLAVTAVGSIDDFVAAQEQPSPGAAGEEVADFFDVDIGL